MKYKTCRKCAAVKTLAEFGNYGRDLCRDCKRIANKLWKRTSKGKEAHARYQRKKRHRIKKRLLQELNSHQCKYCGEEHIACLDFHHKDPNQKLFAVSQYHKWNKILLEEASKCEVICVNCHRKIHWRANG